MSAKIANRKKKHKIFAKYFSHPRSPHHLLGSTHGLYISKQPKIIYNNRYRTFF